MKLTFLGTGTSTGIPSIGCHCPVCRSSDPRDKRFRASAIVTTDSGHNILIDCGPDFRQQILRLDSLPLEAALITHIHFDHVGGIEDLRPYCYERAHLGGFPIYCEESVDKGLHERLPYCFAKNHYPGAPVFMLRRIEPGIPIAIAGQEITPLRIMHSPTNPIVGFRFGNRLAYITDCKTMPDDTLRQLRGIDTLVINALRIEPHDTHMNLRQALDVIKVINPRRAWLTHLSHDMGLHAQVNPTLPEGIEIAYDGLTIEA